MAEANLIEIGKLFEWGDKTGQGYLAEKRGIQGELSHLIPEEQRPEVIEQLKRFLAGMPAAWDEASQGDWTRLAQRLFEKVWVQNERVVAIRPGPELRCFSQISEECQVESLSGDPDRIRTDDLCLDRAVC